MGHCDLRGRQLYRSGHVSQAHVPLSKPIDRQIF